jgi:hypothetical protein
MFGAMTRTTFQSARSMGTDPAKVRVWALMRYAILMFSDPAHTNAISEDELAEILSKHELLRDELTRSGELLNGAGLGYPEDTTVLRRGPDGVVVSSGPLIPADEHMTAYYVIDCESHDRARVIAERTRDHHVTVVELREIHDSAGF